MGLELYFLFIYFEANDDRSQPGMSSACTSSNTIMMAKW